MRSLISEAISRAVRRSRPRPRARWPVGEGDRVDGAVFGLQREGSADDVRSSRTMSFISSHDL